MLAQRPELLDARWIHDETVLHFLAIEGFTEGVRFLAVRGADVNAVNEFGDTALVDIASNTGSLGSSWSRGGSANFMRTALRMPGKPQRLSRTL